MSTKVGAIQAGSKGWEKERQRLKELAPEPYIACWKSLAEADYRETLKKISIPALLIYGAASKFYTNATAHYVKEQVTDAVLHIYEETDHSPHQWQRVRFAHDLLACLLLSSQLEPNREHPIVSGKFCTRRISTLVTRKAQSPRR